MINFHVFRVSEEEIRYSYFSTKQNLQLTSFGYNSSKTENQAVLSTDTNLYIYAAIMVSIVILACGRSFLFIKVAMIASKKMHSKMFHSLLLSPMKFFNHNPCGRIFNRFCKDIGSLDERLPIVLLDAIQVIIKNKLTFWTVRKRYTTTSMNTCM